MGSAQVQGRLWGARPADWADNEAMCTPFYEAVLDVADVGAGTRLLDLGCGAGTAMLLAAKRGATVAGIDASAGLLAFARDRLPEADLREAEIERLPYADGAFDVVTAFNSLGYCADQVAALREAARVTAPGGRVAVLAWGDVARCEMRALFAALGELHPKQDDARVAAPPRTLDETMAAAGLAAPRTGEVELSLVWPDLATAVRIQSSSGPARLAIEAAGEDATRTAITEAFSGFRRPDGRYQMDNVFRYLVATV